MFCRFVFSFSMAMFLLLLVPAASARKSPSKGSVLMYVGTYTGPNSKGIYAYRFDTATGQATPLGLAAETQNPSFLVIDPSNRFLYAANEISDYKGEKSGAISAFAIDRKSGKLTLLNQVSSHGAGPCYVSLDRTGKHVLAANYDGGNVAVFPVLRDGRLGEISSEIKHSGPTVDPLGAEPHQIDLTPDNRFAITSYLGLDKLMLYSFDAAKGTLSANDLRFVQLGLNARPRHFAPDPAFKYIYLLEEASSKVDGFSYDKATGDTAPDGDSFNFAFRFQGRQYDCGNQRASQREISLRFEPRGRQHRGFRPRRRHRRARISGSGSQPEERNRATLK